MPWRSQRRPSVSWAARRRTDIRPRAAMADKGYDAKSNRQAARARGICPVIPYRSNTRDKPKTSQRPSIRVASASSRPRESSSASSVSPYVARKPPRATPLSSLSLVASSGQNPSTRPKRLFGKSVLRASLGFVVMIQALDVDRTEPWPDGQDRQEDQALPV